VRLEPYGEGETALVDLPRRRRRDLRRALERLAHVAEEELAVLDPSRVRAFLLERVLDLEEVREVAARVDPHDQVDRLGVVVQDRQLLVEPLRDDAAPDDRQLRVDVDGAGAGHEEEARLEVVEVVGRQRVQPLPVHAQHPPRQEAGVEREEPRRVGEARLDVAARVADDERVPVEDLDGAAVAHRPGAGKTRWNRRSSSGSPSTVRVPRRTAAWALIVPATIPSRTSRLPRTTQSALPPRRETETSPLSTETSHRCTFPFVISIRSVPVTRRRRGSCPRSRRESKNVVACITRALP
jgi:hypothetical protein